MPARKAASGALVGMRFLSADTRSVSASIIWFSDDVQPWSDVDGTIGDRRVGGRPQ